MKPIRSIAIVVATLCTTALSVLTLRRRSFRQAIRRTRHRLEHTPLAKQRFSVDMVADLPEPVQRYITHAIAPGTLLASSVALTMQGHIKLGEQWNPFTACQILAPFRGFVWSARVAMRKLWLEGADTYADGHGHVRFDMFGLITVVNSIGENVDRSAIGRLVGESVWQPAALLPTNGVQWEAVDDRHINATVQVHGETVTLKLTIDETGRLVALVFDRWHSDEHCYVPFGLVPLEERSFGGYTIPSYGHVGWWYGTQRYEQEGKFFEMHIEQASFW